MLFKHFILFNFLENNFKEQKILFAYRIYSYTSILVQRTYIHFLYRWYVKPEYVIVKFMLCAVFKFRIKKNSFETNAF